MASNRSVRACAAHRGATRALAGFLNVAAPVREELAQEATLKTLTAAGVLQPARFAAKVARRLAIDLLRRRTEVLVADVSDQDEADAWQRRVEARLELAWVRSTLAAAPRCHRDTVRELYFEDRTLGELVELRLADDPRADRGRVQDALYKRRRRATEWLEARRA